LATLEEVTDEILAVNQEKIIGKSPTIKKVIETAKKLADNPYFTTLFVGENGTGKELVAKMIHEYGINSERPFVDIIT